MIVFDTPLLEANARIAADKWTLLRAMADVVDSPAALTDAVARGFANPAARREARQRARDLFAYPGSATARAIAVVYDLLDLPQDAHALLHHHRHA